MFHFVVDLITRTGYFGVFFLMALENLFPPIPSGLIMPFAGCVVSKSDLNLAGHGRWLTISANEIEKSVSAFERHGRGLVLFGRMTSGTHTHLGSVGIAGMNLLTFVGYTTAGSLLWTSILTSAGYLLEKNYTAVGKHVDPLSQAIGAAIVVAYVYRVATHRSKPTK